MLPMLTSSDTAEMVLNKGLLIISTLLCLLGVNVAACCPQSLYTDSQGTIQSPGFNTTGRYDANMSCMYNIRVSAGRRIILEFKNLSILGRMPECEEDYVEIMIGCTNTSIGKFCSCSNLSMPDKIYSYDNCMTLVFKSDDSNQGKGFEAQYTTADNTAARLDPKNCSTDSVSPSHGTIYTPNWPLKYPGSASCVWTFNPPPRTIVRFFFTGFDLDGDPICDPSRPPQTGDQISIYGTNTSGCPVIVEKRLCTMPADAFFPIKNMKAIAVRFGSNSVRTNDGNGVMAGYATYIKGYLNSSSSGCKVSAPQSELPVVPNPQQNVIVNSRSSRVVNITWTAGFDCNSDILSYTVEISEDNKDFVPARCKGMSSSACIVSGYFISASLTGLHPGRIYYIRVFATNKVGQSVASSVMNTSTIEEAPNAPPSNVKGQYRSSTSVLVQWGNVPAANQNGVILSYTVTYRALPDGSNETKTVSARQATLTGLNEHTNYSITVFASTVKGGGIVSAPIIIITDEDIPSSPPSYVQGQYASSTSIFVQWGAVPVADQNGVILSYTVAYRALPDGSPQTKVVNVSITNTTLMGLNEYTKYSITMFASTVKGGGTISAPIFVITDEDTPNAPPANVKGYISNVTNVLIQWGNVPAADQNGIILSYTVTYKALPNGSPQTKVVEAPTTQTILGDLKENTTYGITVFASTVKGDGNISSPIIVVTDLKNVFQSVRYEV